MNKLALGLAGLALIGLTACGNGSGPSRSEIVAASTPVTTGESGDPWADFTTPDWNHDADYVNKTDTGLEYIVLASGSECDNHVTGDDIALAHYEGRLVDGTVFDSSFRRRSPSQFPANRVIRGWTEALGMMCPGDDWLLYLPTDIAYGQTPRPGGPINPGDDLIFRIVLINELDLTNYPEEIWTGDAFQ